MNWRTTTCSIKGTDPAGGEIILSAHLFDGLFKMGANDNLSGCASILEIARMLNRMIREGRIERPKRTISLSGHRRYQELRHGYGKIRISLKTLL